jgi:BASS family bile acid:Na+ symporter
MQGDIVSGVLLPLILAFIMFSLGLGLTVGDFRRILAQPRALLVGVVCHFVLLPLACFLILSAWGMTGVFAVGFMILAACPTGSTSNLLTYLARGDVALALSFTAVASVATIFTLPLVVTWALGHFLGEAGGDVPVGLMMGQVALVLGLPVSLGMFARHRWSAWAQRFEPRATRVATVLFVLIVVLAVAKNWALLRDNFATLAPFALLLNLSMLCVGFGVAWAARLSRSQSVTLGIETAVQNAALALVIASTVLQDDAMAIPGALYGVLMYAGGPAVCPDHAPPAARRPNHRHGCHNRP